ncbi:MAG: BREX-1 system phosphatase PglZ type A [Flavobacteriaceae bacterium]|nr:BREX-1 system phosphatase PglZ type A [Flavobacteriaceae bacterium]
MSIEELLNKYFSSPYEKDHVIFWYDPDREFEEEYKELGLEGVEKIKVSYDEFSVQYRIYKKYSQRKKEKQKFLLYFPYAKPKDEDNLFLGWQYAYTSFSPKKEFIYAQELGLDEENHRELLRAHTLFLNSKLRRNKLQSLLKKEDTDRKIRLKMIAVVLKPDYYALNSLLLQHLVLHIQHPKKSLEVKKNLEKYQLWDYYWRYIQEDYGFVYLNLKENQQQTIYDFVLDLFNATPVEDKLRILEKEFRAKSIQDAKNFLYEWKTSKIKEHESTYQAISKEISREFNIEKKLSKIPNLYTALDSLVHDDHYELIEQKIIHVLSEEIQKGNLSSQQVQEIIKKREHTFWYEDYKDYYDALRYGAELTEKITFYRERKKDENKSYVLPSTLELGVEQYASTLYRIDQLYRLFGNRFKKTNYSDKLKSFDENIDNQYNNTWLLEVNDQWQKIIDQRTHWPVKIYNAQQNFYQNHIKPIITRLLERKEKGKVFVLISDALRYECGEELHRKIHYNAEFKVEKIDYLISSIPSYTQLGMASLLPRKRNLTLERDKIFIDGQSSSGLENRNLILQSFHQNLETDKEQHAIALKSDDFIQNSKEYIKKHQLFYIYSNIIDHQSHNQQGHQRTFDAVDKEIENLYGIVKTIQKDTHKKSEHNILITSDHGFIYQKKDLHESDFSAFKISNKDKLWYKDRRFLIGQNIISPSSEENSHEQENQLYTHFHAPKIGLDNEDVDILFPKSINRLRMSGATIHFVHGGTSLQEIVVPLIKISTVNKKEQKIKKPVEIKVIVVNPIITTSSTEILFRQEEPISHLVEPMRIKAGIYNKDDELISDEFQYLFDGDEKTLGPYQGTWGKKHFFQLTAKGQKNGETVFLKVYKPIKNSSQWKIEEEKPLVINVAFAQDF